MSECLPLTVTCPLVTWLMIGGGLGEDCPSAPLLVKLGRPSCFSFPGSLLELVVVVAELTQPVRDAYGGDFSLTTDVYGIFNAVTSYPYSAYNQIQNSG